jgi:DNA replication and repair protein RecF
MEGNLAAVLSRRSSVSGPHRDEIVFRINGDDARVYASQGQQRTIALAWKLAEVEVVSDIAAQPPILLLDDVMSELDERRRHALAALVGSVTQTVMTTTNLGYFEEGLLERAKVVALP